ncbi:MAG TPA: hypothetical protein VHZ97_15115 [Pseudonocardiaceae bacterium]|nr:hypothetical protein [Pseudonocardiaceae bacterium]
MTSARRSDPDSPDVDESLRQAVLHRLAALEQIAEDDTDLAAHLPLARSELSRLADGWRLLLTVHGAGEDGRCRACPGWVRHRRPWPCPVWLMAHQHLLGDPPPALLRHSRRHPLRRLGHLLGRVRRTR